MLNLVWIIFNVVGQIFILYMDKYWTKEAVAR